MRMGSLLFGGGMGIRGGIASGGAVHGAACAASAAGGLVLFFVTDETVDQEPEEQGKADNDENSGKMGEHKASFRGI